MPRSCVSTFPILAEMTFLKMVAILVIDRFNRSRFGQHYGNLAAGPVSSELANLCSARMSVSSALPNEKIERLISDFNSFNKYSMVCYPVGMHYNYFHKNKESVENKLLLCCSKQRGSHGRGGSLSGSQFVYALLDW